MRLASFLVTIISACSMISAANAQRIASRTVIVCGQQGCSDRSLGARMTRSNSDFNIIASAVDANGSEVVVGGRPDGCPYQFCGCEASRYVFGEIRPQLNLASNWLRAFPRAAAGTGMAAVRNHHVMILISHVSDRHWLVHDGNSGNHLTREHVRSIVGYVIVDPHAVRTSSTAP